MSIAQQTTDSQLPEALNFVILTQSFTAPMQDQIDKFEEVKNCIIKNGTLEPESKVTPVILKIIATLSGLSPLRPNVTIIKMCHHWLSEKGVLSGLFQKLLLVENFHLNEGFFYDLSSCNELIGAFCHEGLIQDIFICFDSIVNAPSLQRQSSISSTSSHNSESSTFSSMPPETKSLYRIIIMLWNMSVDPRAAVQIMMRGGIPRLIKVLTGEHQLKPQVCGALAALCYTDSVRDLIAQHFNRDPSGIIELIKIIRTAGTETVTRGTGFRAVSVLSFLLLNKNNTELIRQYGGIRAIGEFVTTHKHNFNDYGFDYGELDLLAYEQLILSDHIEVIRFLAFFYARYSLSEHDINTKFEKMVESMTQRSSKQLHVLCLHNDTKVRSFALLAISELGISNPSIGLSQTENWLEYLGCSDSKKLVKLLNSQLIDLPCLVDPNTHNDDLRESLKFVLSKGLLAGEFLKILTSAHNISEILKQNIQETKKTAKLYSESFMKTKQQEIFYKINNLNNQNEDNQSESHNIKYPVFLSYCWANKEAARKIYNKINENGIGVWMDEGTISGGDELFQQIDQGISNASVIISCISMDYAKSANCNREVCLADARKKLLIPVLVDDVLNWPPPGSMAPLLAPKLYVDLKNETKLEENFTQLLATIRKSL